MATHELKEIPVIFYRTQSDEEPLRDWLRSLDVADRRRIGEDLATLQFAWPVGMPLCRSLGEGLWELRSTLPSHRIARLLFTFHNGKLGLVHGFIKKTEKTPVKELALARKRMKEMTS
jgi:phage-related protein